MGIIQRIKRGPSSRVGHRVATTVAMTGVISGSILAMPGVASAAAGGYNGVCGSGYIVKASADLHDQGVAVGTVYLTYSSSTGNNCVVTIKRYVGVGPTVSTFIERDDNSNSYTSEFGPFSKYAGPVYLYAKETCVSWGGEIGDAIATREHTNCG